MPSLHFTKENMPASSEEFSRMLREAVEQSNPIDDLLELAEDLRNFEQKYGMASDEFFQKFHAGQMGDELDFFEWSFCVKAYRHMRKSIELAMLRGSVSFAVDELATEKSSITVTNAAEEKVPA